MADGDHGQLYLRGEHNVGHGIGEELKSSLVQLIDNDRETENLRHQNVSKISRFTECPELSTFNKDVKKKVGEGATLSIETGPPLTDTFSRDCRRETKLTRKKEQKD